MIYVAITVPIFFFLVLYFGNKRISNRFKKFHQDFLKELDNYNHLRVENIKTKHKIKSVVGFKYKVVYYDIIFLEENIIFEYNFKDRKKNIVHYQPISQFTFNNSNKLMGVYFIQNVSEVIKQRNTLTLKYIRRDTLISLKCNVQLDFSKLDIDVGEVIDSYKIPLKKTPTLKTNKIPG